MSPAPPPSTWNHQSYLSARSLARPQSAIRALLPLEKLPGMISLQAGKPAPQTFPISRISIDVTKSSDFAFATEASEVDTLEVVGEDLVEALQYSATAGLPRLVTLLENWQRKMHNCGPPGDWSLSVTSGSQDALTKAFESLINDGDYVLVESPLFPGVISTLQVQPCTLVPVECDEEGLSATSLKSTLASWPAGRRMPRILYTVPTGGNPSGTTSGLVRRQEVLDICREYEVLLLEDDPYCYLTFEERVPSYFELDAGRGGVVRFDSFSKILSSGLRIGFITGPKIIVDAVNLHTSSSNLQTSSTSQAITQSLLLHWGLEGLETHCKAVAIFYKTKRDAFELAARRQLDGLADWVTPVAGMFLWLKLRLPSGDSQALIATEAVRARVLAVPGFAFFTDGRPSPSVRVSFSIASIEDADEGFRRLAACIVAARSAPSPLSSANLAVSQPARPSIGLLKLDNSFYRGPGDVGHASTFACPLEILTISGATNDAVVGNGTSGWSPALVDAFIDGARQLVDERGAIVLLTSCGFLATMHQELVAKLDRPGVALGTTSLLQVPLAKALNGGDVGVLTFDQGALTDRHLSEVGADNKTTIVRGMLKGGAFQRWISHQSPFDFDACCDEMVEVAKRLVEENKSVRSIVLECTNMPPFAHAVQEATKLPVFDVVTLGNSLFEAATRRSFK